MAMTTEQLRAALGDLNGQRDVRVAFERAEACVIEKALLVPVEEDRIVKLTDGSREFLLDAERIAWIEIG
jgi:hypothetical protein